MNTSRCNTCGEKAVIFMRQHRLPLCKTHYLEWFIEQSERAIKKYGMFTHHDKILVAVSGGKDSLSLWDVLWRLGYQADGLYINLGIDGEDHYSLQSKNYTVSFAAERNLNLHIFDVAAETGKNIIQLYKQSQRRKGRPCSVCGVVKRHIMNETTRNYQYNVLATGHNLDDEAAVLFSNTLSWSVEYLARQFPVLEEEEGFARKVKPFCRFYERESAAYALLRGINYIEEECPFSDNSTSLYYKRLLNQLEDAQPGTKIRFFSNFIEARKKGALFQAPESEKVVLNPCPVCGQPTGSSGKCYYCRITAPTVVENNDDFPPDVMSFG
ncbi:MAG: adenine nucleotide alpha hydrolase family protein [Anaerolineae bacterium]|nr:adenine nucleotide alpha hydrolase family protein [Anaerolineae bacterium]